MANEALGWTYSSSINNFFLKIKNGVFLIQNSTEYLLLPLSFAPNSPRAPLAFHVIEDDSFSHETFDHFSE